MTLRLYRKCGFVVGALAISALAAGPALARGTTTTSYTCSVTPTLVTNMSTYAVSGSGYAPGVAISVYIKDRVSTWIVPGTVAANGTFSISPISSTIFYPSDLGTKNVSVVYTSSTKTVLCSTTFSVK